MVLDSVSVNALGDSVLILGLVWNIATVASCLWQILEGFVVF